MLFNLTIKENDCFLLPIHSVLSFFSLEVGNLSIMILSNCLKYLGGNEISFGRFS